MGILARSPRRTQGADFNALFRRRRHGRMVAAAGVA
jgi:hypothetical protein